MLFEETAGLVPVEVLRDGDRPVGATLTAPQPFRRLGEADVTEAAACLGLRPAQIREDRHPPVVGTVGLPFLLVELADRAALAAARPVTGAILGSPTIGPVKDIHCYLRTGGADGFYLRTRMFAPLDGVPEDPATGSANAVLAGLLADFDGPADGVHRLRIPRASRWAGRRCCSPRPNAEAAPPSRSGSAGAAWRSGAASCSLPDPRRPTAGIDDLCV